MKRLLSIGTMLVWFAGCTSDDNRLPYSLVITEEGLGAIKASTPFEEAGHTLMGFETRKLSQITPRNPELIWELRRGKSAIAHIVSDTSGKKIDRIEILDPRVKNRLGKGLGDTLDSASQIDCNHGECRYANEPSVLYRIDDSRTIREIVYRKL